MAGNIRCKQDMAQRRFTRRAPKRGFFIVSLLPTWVFLALVCNLFTIGSLSAAQAQSLAPTSSSKISEFGEVDLPIALVAAGKICSAVVGPTLMDTQLTSVGRIAYDDLHVSHVFSPVTGRVERILGQLGQHVVEGQILAHINSPDLGVAQSDQDKARTDLQTAVRDLKRQEFLYERHATSEREVETARDTWRRATAEMARAAHKLDILGGGCADCGGEIFRLKSTLAGEIISRSISLGDEVQGQYTGGATRELFTVANLKKVWVVADLYEQDVGRIHVGARVEVHVDAAPKQSFEGRIDWVADVLDPNVRTAKVRCAIANPEGLLKPDMFATLRIDAKGHEVIAIPKQSVTHIGSKSFVFVVQGEKSDKTVRYVRRPVVVDEDTDEASLPVLHGLSVGEKVVTVGLDLLTAALKP